MIRYIKQNVDKFFPNGSIGRRLFVVGLTAFCSLWCTALILLMGTYQAPRYIHKKLQTSDSFVWKLMKTFLSVPSPTAFLFLNYNFFLANKSRPRLSSGVSGYVDGSSGYYSHDFDMGDGESIETQQRGKVLELLLPKLATLPEGAKVCEIGTGNGDVPAYLSEKFPEIFFEGVDFSVNVATEKHLGNVGRRLSFKEGYGLDLLQAQSLSGDVLFASSTFVLFTPKEIDKYFELLSRSFNTVILNELILGDYQTHVEGEPTSIHMDENMWFHEYILYAKKYNFALDQYTLNHYNHPTSLRPDIKLFIGSFTQEGGF